MSKFECYVGEDIWGFEFSDIRKEVCKNLPAYGAYEGNEYCVLHYPNEAKIPDFEKVLGKKISSNNFDFRGIWFPTKLNVSGIVFEESVDFRFSKFFKDADFSNAEFTKGVYLYDATFFEKADFSYVEFSEEVEFNEVLFKAEVDFSQASFFGETSFYRTFFLEPVDFNSAKFKENSITDFTGVSFHKKVDFSAAKINGYLNINGFWKMDMFPSAGKSKFFSVGLINPESSLILRDIQLPTSKKLSINSVRMKPSWLVNTNFGDMELTNISWDDVKGTSEEMESELNGLIFEYGIQYTHNLLTVTYRKLSENCVKNQDFENASNFRRLAFVAEKKLRKKSVKEWQNNLINIGQDKILISQLPDKFFELINWIKESPNNILHFFYGSLSGYGEKWFRALIWLIILCPTFALLYYLFGTFENSSLSGIGDFIGYSIQVITLQKPDPKPLGWTRLLYGLESILGPTQLALLALAIRRRFMN